MFKIQAILLSTLSLMANTLSAADRTVVALRTHHSDTTSLMRVCEQVIATVRTSPTIARITCPTRITCPKRSSSTTSLDRLTKLGTTEAVTATISAKRTLSTPLANYVATRSFRVVAPAAKDGARACSRTSDLASWVVVSPIIRHVSPATAASSHTEPIALALPAAAFPAPSFGAGHGHLPRSAVTANSNTGTGHGRAQRKLSAFSVKSFTSSTDSASEREAGDIVTPLISLSEKTAVKSVLAGLDYGDTFASQSHTNRMLTTHLDYSGPVLSALTSYHDTFASQAQIFTDPKF